MSETDSFFREVEEEVRHDRMFRLWKKYGPYAIAAVVCIVAAAGAMSWMKHRAEQQARETGGGFLAAEIGNVTEQVALIASLKGETRAVARLRLAASQAAAGDVKAAADLYMEVANKPGLDPAYADLARLRAVRLRAPTGDPAELMPELDRLAAEGAPYRLLAIELRAALRLNAGDTEAAHDDLAALITDPLATRQMRERASVMLLSSGGTLPQAGQ